jgi:hypothetical protein
MADRFGLGVSFAVPLLAYAFIAIFALAARESAPPVEARPDPLTSVPPIP